MKLLVGLGNPGKEFERTPHNAGFVALDRVVYWLQKRSISTETWKKSASHEKSELTEAFLPSGERLVVLAKPQTYMNLSGGAVQRLMQKYGIKNQDDVLVIYDELDIALGNFKYSPIKNSHTHKGIASIISTIGKGIQSLRIGVDHRASTYIPGESYVLQRYSEAEMALLTEGIDKALELHLKDFLGLL